MRSSGYWLETVGFAFHRRSYWRTDPYSCAEMFRSGTSETGLLSITFSKGGISRDGYSMTLRFIYREEPAP